MGFYQPAQIVRDACEHGVTVLPVDVNRSHWDCTLEPLDGGNNGNASFETAAPQPPQDEDLFVRRKESFEKLLTVAPQEEGLFGWHKERPHPEEPPQAASRRTHNALPERRLALRLGFRQIKGFSQADAGRLVASRGAGYPDAAALWHRGGLGRLALERLAAADALRSITLDRRQGLWALKALGEAPLPLFAFLNPSPAMREREGPTPQAWEGEGMAAQPSPVRGLTPTATLSRNAGEGNEVFAASLLPPMLLGEHVVEDYASTSLSLKRHPLAFLRGELAQQGIVTAAKLATLPAPYLTGERRVQVAGLVLIRQRPDSAKGVIFTTIEDETGIANLIIWPPILERFRRTALGATLLYCKGRLQREEGVIHVVADDLRDFSPLLRTLRQREAAEPHASPRKPAPRPVDTSGIRDISIPDIVIRSRDFH